jgi:hypothetical protein
LSPSERLPRRFAPFRDTCFTGACFSVMGSVLISGSQTGIFQISSSTAGSRRRFVPQVARLTRVSWAPATFANRFKTHPGAPPQSRVLEGKAVDKSAVRAKRALGKRRPAVLGDAPQGAPYQPYGQCFRSQNWQSLFWTNAHWCRAAKKGLACFSRAAVRSSTVMTRSRFA